MEKIVFNVSRCYTGNMQKFQQRRYERSYQ